MQGFVVERKAGWDAHGLPVEREVEKTLGLNTLAEVESFGVERFNRLCAESVWKYQAEWENLTRRMGYWTDMKNRYATLDLEYMESEWWALQQLWKKGFLERGYKVMPYSPKTGCTYSNRDVAVGYKEVTDLTCYVRFPLVAASLPPKLTDLLCGAAEASLLAWTSTPWTLPGNVLLAVNETLMYVFVEVTEAGSAAAEGGSDRGPKHPESETSHFRPGEVLCVAEALLPDLEKKMFSAAHKPKVVARLPGSELVGAKYAPPFPAENQGEDCTQLWRVVAGSFVDSKTGTGLVHVAPMYGEDDFLLCMSLGFDLSRPECQHVVGQDGCFMGNSRVPVSLQGLDVTCERTQEEVLDLLQQRERLCLVEQLTHSYPHCWRNKNHRLLRYAMESWFVTMGDPTVRVRMQQLNREEVRFAPERVKDGRFGNWLKESRDWCVSRRRTWGCPLPLWVCHKELGGCGAECCVGSSAELRSMLIPGCEEVMLDDLHTTTVDSLQLQCSVCSSVTAMSREPYVLDCWFDSGCAPFAQHYDTKDNADHPVVDFVAEGQDQCRGWFYNLLALSTTLFDRPAFKKCLVLGLVLDKDGKKMSKSLGNGVDPWHHFNEEGADAVRWYLLGMCAPWADRRFDVPKVRSANQKFFCILFNVSKWWHTQWSALPEQEKSGGDYSRPGVLNRWVLSRLASVVQSCNESFEKDQFHVAVNTLETFVGEDLSKVFVRLSRAHFSRDPSLTFQPGAKTRCLQTMRTVLLYVSRLVAPLAPFFVDTLHRSLMESLTGFASPNHSVHLAAWPTPADVSSWLDPLVEKQMGWLLSLMEAGRALHAKGDRPGRLPLAQAWVSRKEDAESTSHDELAQLLGFALNVRKVCVLSQEQFQEKLQEVQEPVLAPNLGKLGARYKEEAKELLNALELEFGPLIVNDEKKQKKALAKKGPGSWKGSNAEKALQLLQAEGELVVETAGKTYNLHLEDFNVSWLTREGFSVSPEAGLVLDLTVNAEQVSAYLAKEVVHFVHQLRKSVDKQRLDKGQGSLGQVFLCVVVQERKNGSASEEPVLTDVDWSVVLQATMANPLKSLLVQRPDPKVLVDCEVAARDGRLQSLEVRGYGDSCVGFRVFVRCVDVVEEVDMWKW
ncbi:Isoleucine--tRNA ligase (Fragment) [Seminavis robusta]|uniref:isoleucine--tRNA ligase n=1 Tax=Seminavis robusta TaxID=568900 RepID=A0A9N8ENI9_9STRA